MCVPMRGRGRGRMISINNCQELVQTVVPEARETVVDLMFP